MTLLKNLKSDDKRQASDDKRQGMILLVVLAMLTLLAIIGITFVSYASSLEQCSEAAVDEQKAAIKPRFDPEAALSMFLGQFVYDAEDDATGKYSVLRGHSLARDLYGYTAADTNKKVLFPLDRPFGAAGYADPDSPNFIGQASISGQPNVPYTAADNRHWFLAKMAYTTQGQMFVNEPSFWRNTPSVTNPTGIQNTFRYRPNQEMASGFPAYPTQSQQYDVQNLPFGTGPDSIWIDINAPVQTLPNGRKYKMMVAPLIVDLDGRLNLAMAGNKMTSLNNNWFHGSHEGHGPWEANIDRVVALLKAQGDPVLSAGNISAIQSTVLGIKYGAYGFPYGMVQTGGGSGGLSSSYSPRAHNQVDFNGGLDPNPFGLTGPVPSMLPGSVGGVAQPSQPYQAFPYFHPGMYGNWAYNETTNNGQSTGTYIHPNAYSPLFPNGSQAVTGFNVAFAIRDMGPLMLWRSDKDTFAKDVSNNSPVKQALSPLLSSYGQNTSRSNFFDHVTLLSADFDKPGIAPFLNSNQAMTGLEWASPTTAPYRPRRQTNNFNQPPGGEQNTLGLATRTLTRYARINLGVFGPDYPAIDGSTGQYIAGSTTQVTAATQGRSLLATKVLQGLCAATGTPDMREVNDLANTQYKAWVWLAQLAVNIVDFVDPDDVMTAMDLSPSASPGTGRTVYGTELPKVVINEIYAQIDNGSAADFSKTGSQTINSDFNVSLFLELLNPLNDSTPPIAANVNRPNTAFLQVVNGTSIHTVYEIEVTKTAPTAIKDPFATNAMGVTDLGGVVNFTTNTLAYVANNPFIPSPNPWADASGSSGTVKIEPAGGNYTAANPKDGSQGFLWIGPKVSTYLQEPQAQAAFTPLEQNDASSTSRGLTYTVPKATSTLAKANEATVLLRRLVNPGLPADATTNPYVLVDYVTVQYPMIEDARKRLLSSSNAAYSATITSRMSFGRRQPFAGKDIVDATATPKDLGAYKASTKTNASGPMHTFGSMNFNTQPAVLTNEINAATETAETPDWMAHFDRVPVSPLSLLMVSTYRPHELTQKFLDQIPSPINAGTNIWVPHQHAAGWMDEMTGLQRFFELVQTHGESSLTNNVSQQVSLFPMGGRYQGRVNLNTVPIYQDSSGQYRSPVLEALFDANNSNRFTQDQIRVLINSLGARRAAGTYFYGPNPSSRTGSVLESQAPAMVNSNDPWQNYQYGGGAANGYALNGNLVFDPFAIDPTAQPNGAPLRTAVQTTHPMVRLEALEKIQNQSTVRSNVFGIWVTVGFFEVLDSTTSPVKLGGEIGAASGRNVRHKMFAIVDRTRIKSFETASTLAVTASLNATTGDYAWQTVPVTLADFTDSRTQKVYNLKNLAQQQALVLTFDPDKETEETVEAFFDGTNLVAQFRGNHTAGCRIISRGNPGPMKNYDHKDDGDVVLYWTVLE